MLKIYVTRHGQDEDNKNGLLNGHRDYPLTPLGEEQAHTLGLKIKDADLHFDVVYSSPLKRALKTAEIICEVSVQPQPIVLDSLIERDFGVMTGEKISDIKKMCSPNIFEASGVTYFTSCKGAESFDETLVRAQKVLDFIRSKNTDGSVLIVAHGDIGKMLYTAFYKLSWQEALTHFHLGNTELICMSEDIDPEHVYMFRTEQHNI